MATVSDVINTAYSLLNETSSSSFVSDTISLNFVNEAIRDVYLRTMIIVSSTTINVTSGDYQYDLPSNFMAIPTRDAYKNICTYITVSGAETELKYKQLPDFFPKSATNGTPAYFTIKFSASSPFMEILLDPTPNATGTINLLYIPQPKLLTSTSATIPLPHNLTMPLAYYVCWLYKYRDRDPAIGDRFFVMYDAMLRKYGGSMSTSLRKPKVVWAGITDQK